MESEEIIKEAQRIMEEEQEKLLQRRENFARTVRQVPQMRQLNQNIRSRPTVQRAAPRGQTRR